MQPERHFKIFLVDDDPVYRQMYAFYLKSLGHNDIQEFSDGQQCINNLGQRPDIIVLDHEMLPLDGIDTLRKIKRFDPDIYVIYLSGQERMQVTVNALKYGAFDYVVKGDANEKKRISDILQKIRDLQTLIAAQKARRSPKLFSFFSQNSKI